MNGQHTGHGHAHQHGAGCGHDHHHGPGPAADSVVVTDPVCGMKVDPATSKDRLEHGGTTFHFCSAGCRPKFEAEPEKYPKPEKEAAPTAAQKSALYNCPMHPHTRQAWPGHFTILALCLEPREGAVCG